MNKPGKPREPSKEPAATRAASPFVSPVASSLDSPTSDWIDPADQAIEALGRTPTAILRAARLLAQRRFRSIKEAHLAWADYIDEISDRDDQEVSVDQWTAGVYFTILMDLRRALQLDASEAESSILRAASNLAVWVIGNETGRLPSSDYMRALKMKQTKPVTPQDVMEFFQRQPKSTSYEEKVTAAIEHFATTRQIRMARSTITRRLADAKKKLLS